MTEAEAAWLAGILEGEGCFDWNRQGEGKKWPRIRIAMNDEDIVRRVKAITGGTASVRRETRANKPNWNDTFLFQVAHRDQVRYVLESIRPWMSERRGKKIDEMLAVLDTHRLT